MFKGLRKKYIRKVKARVHDYMVLHFEKIQGHEMQVGLMRYNFRCYYNSAHDFFQAPKKLTVHLVYCAEGDDARFNFLHVINRNVTTGKYVDNTLGYLHKAHEYYYIKEIPPDSLLGDRAWLFFNEYRRALLKQFCNKTYCKIMGIDMEDFI
jgi:hypothetical protein